MNVFDKFKEDIDEFIKRTGVPRTRMGWEIMKDPHAISNWLIGKGNPRISSMQRVYDYMENYKSPKKEEPEIVPEISEPEDPPEEMNGIKI